MSEVIGLGQRTGSQIAGEYTPEEIQLLATSGMDVAKANHLFSLFPDATLNVVLGTYAMLIKGDGTVPADAAVAADVAPVIL